MQAGREEIYQLPSAKGFEGENGQLCTCNIFTLKQLRNKICKMAHFLPTNMDKAYPWQLVKILITGVAAAVFKTRWRKKGPLGDEFGNTA